MASNDNTDEKPNLRPTKRVTAGGKSVFLHHNPNQPSNKSYIHASWRETDNSSTKNSSDPFGIAQPHVEYSLNKRQRWEVLHNFRQHITNESDSSSDDDRAIHSDDEQTRKKKTSKIDRQSHSTKYRLYELHNTDQQANCVGITSNIGSPRVQVPKKTYMTGPKTAGQSRRREGHAAATENNDGRRQQATADITYYALVPPPREKQLTNIRKQHNTKAKKVTSSAQRMKFSQAKERVAIVEQFDNNDSSPSPVDDDEKQRKENHYSLKPVQLQLNDFIPRISTDVVQQVTPITENLVVRDDNTPKSDIIYLDDVNSGKHSRKFHRQLSKEEKLFNRDMTTYIKMQQNQRETIKPIDKSRPILMSLAFRSILIDKTNLTIEYLSNIYGKHFLHAQSYPTKYAICLTDRLKSLEWLNKFELFTNYTTLNAYLVILLNEDASVVTADFQRVEVALNMDLNAESIEIENLYESTTSIYRMSDVIEKTVEFVTALPFDRFKPIDAELSRKRLVRNEIDSELSESEFINKQIHRLQILDKPDTSMNTIFEEIQSNSDAILDDYTLVRPEICTSCYGDMTETSPMTALKRCAHWLCNNCWKQYLESSIKRVKVILCPEWNCESVVDVGTLLSLVNVRLLNIYEGNIEKCLVNISRSYVKCPSKSCANIVQVIGPSIDHVRCPCGHQFCIQCKQEPHFPATCNAYHLYMLEIYRNGDLISDYNAVTQVQGRNCVSCNNFIEKNGGCNHMTCRCGAEFCWSCTAYWKDHTTSTGAFACPKEHIPLQERVLDKKRSQSKRFYYNAVYHRHERAAQNQAKFKENAKRLLSTIPLDKGVLFDNELIAKQVDKRESVLRHLYEMAKYIGYGHRICEFIAVSADGYGNNPSEFQNSLRAFESTVLNMSQIFEGGRGYQAVEQLKELHSNCEKLIERLQRAVTLRELRRVNTTGYVTS